MSSSDAQAARIAELEKNLKACQDKGADTWQELVRRVSADLAAAKARADAADGRVWGLNESGRLLLERAQVAEREWNAAAARMAELEAMIEARDVCWHCKDCLVPSVPVCERCPLPGDCDDEGCKAEGCADQTTEADGNQKTQATPTKA